MTKEAVMTKKLSDKDVVAFLKANPAFFDEHPDMVPTAAQGKGVADFQQAMLAKLKNDKTKVQDLQRELIENARANMNNYNRIQTAVLATLEAESFEEFIEIVTEDLPVMLDVDTINLVIESASKEIPFVNQAGIRFAKAGTVKKWLSTGDVLLQSNISGHEDMFGPGAGLVRSQALVRLEISDNSTGIMAFGSRDPELFQPNQAVDQVGFLSQVIERCFRLWLDVQE